MVATWAPPEWPSGAQCSRQRGWPVQRLRRWPACARGAVWLEPSGRGDKGHSRCGRGPETVSVLGYGSLWALSRAPGGTGQCWEWSGSGGGGTVGRLDLC